MRAPRVVIAAGGTAGHVVPAIAVADALRAEGATVSFVGGERAEAELVPAAGTSSASARWPPANETCAPSARSASATAMAGTTCPAVPPAAITIRGALTVAPLPRRPHRAQRILPIDPNDLERMKRVPGGRHELGLRPLAADEDDVSARGLQPLGDRHCRHHVSRRPSGCDDH